MVDKRDHHLLQWTANNYAKKLKHALKSKKKSLCNTNSNDRSRGRGRSLLHGQDMGEQKINDAILNNGWQLAALGEWQRLGGGGDLRSTAGAGPTLSLRGRAGATRAASFPLPRTERLTGTVGGWWVRADSHAQAANAQSQTT